MVDPSPQFDIDDAAGSTVIYSGTVGTTPEDLPTVADKVIRHIIVDNQNNGATKTIEYSLDGGTTYKTVLANDAIGHVIRGSLKQIKLKGGAAGVDYEIILQFEE